MIDFSDDALYFRPHRARWPYTLGAIAATMFALAFALQLAGRVLQLVQPGHLPPPPLVARIAWLGSLAAAALVLPALASLVWHRQRASGAVVGALAYLATALAPAAHDRLVLAALGATLVGLAAIARLGAACRALVLLAAACALATTRFDPATRAGLAIALLFALSLVAAFAGLALRIPALAKLR